MYGGVNSIFKKYWDVYGGTKALIKSPYFHAAILLLLLNFNFWLYDTWWDQSIAVLPTLLGFSLGGFAMFLGFGNEKFREFLVDTENELTAPSEYLVLCGSFVHFIILQIVALLFATTSKSLNFNLDWPFNLNTAITYGTYFFNAVGYLLFLYSITSMLAATMAVFRICTWFEMYQVTSINSQKYKK